MRSDAGLYPRFSMAEYERRYGLLRVVMAGVEADALVIYGDSSNRNHVHYVSNYSPSQPCYVVLPALGTPTMFVQLYNHWPNSREISVIPDTRFGGMTAGEPAIQQLKELGPERARVGLVGAAPYQQMNRLQRALPDADFVDLTAAFLRVRTDKSDEEIEWMRRAAALTDLSLEALERDLRPGMTEYEALNIGESAYVRQGGVTQIHYLASTAMGNPELCVPTQWVANRVIERGDVVITEVSAQYWGYAGQIHRPIAVGEVPTAAYRRMYDFGVEAYERIKAVLRPGATARDVLDAADFIDRSEYTVYDDLLHGFGGGYLAPVLRTRKTALESEPDFVFRRNMTVVLQPNIITPDERMGLQVGGLLLLTDGGAEEMQKFPMKFIVAGMDEH